VDNVGAYICKYMTKDGGDERLIEKKSYFTSRNLEKPIEITQNSLIESVANSLQAKMLTYENTFKNEFNETQYKQYNMNKDKDK